MELSGFMLAFQQLSTPPLTATCILIGQMQRKPSESCHNEMLKSCRKLLKKNVIQVAVAQRTALLLSGIHGSMVCAAPGIPGNS